ncbi:hemopexin repeat-containing protein [Pseudoalteromonas umbrosa]|uniref:hemopexin repeat-containing protein n=1 Tax=Pseudoalteromonas umbrosa TaxID=3048489 RepID=UPI0024C3A3EB|nr:hemopexin repeat-containing protein [Pseudoalteromonas sp. B95]MDK1287960.1 hemopexin repeat-containing protein [Pseudoalteromonas sp. B95]
MLISNLNQAGTNMLMLNSYLTTISKGNNMNFTDFFNSGIDSINVLPNQKTYITKGKWYVRYSDKNGTKVDEGYPKELVGNWGFNESIGSFATGFDSMATLPNKKTYVTKGEHYLRYSDNNATVIDKGYPALIADNWGDIAPELKLTGFDAMATLLNNKTYVFKGDSYYRYSDLNATSVDPGYPKKIAGNWGKNLPKEFLEGIDAIAVLPNGKTYMFKGDQYIRYSDKSCSQVDQGYPLPIKDHWGFENLAVPSELNELDTIS